MANVPFQSVVVRNVDCEAFTTFDQAKEIYDNWQKETVSDVELVRTKELKVSEIYG